MSLKQYYNTFGLPETASQREIKQRYRELVMRYHPDKVGGNAANFLEIKEAYEYLTGKKTPPTVQTQTTTRSTSTARQQPYEDRIQQAQQRRKENEYKEHIENQRFFEKITSGLKWKFIQASAIVGLIVSLIILIEQFLPYRYEKDAIIAYDSQLIGGISYDVPFTNIVYTEKGRVVYLEKTNFYKVIEPEVFVVKSAIFHNEIGMIPLYKERFNIASAATSGKMYKLQMSLGAHSLLLFPLFIIPFLTVYFKRKTFTFTVAYYTSLYFFSPVIYFYLFTNDRWFHLLTLGFL